MSLHPLSDGETPAADWKVLRPSKPNRRRIVCPTVCPTAQTSEKQWKVPRRMDDRHGGADDRHAGHGQERASRERPEPYKATPRADARPPHRAEPPRQVTLAVRLLYFSRDGAQADSGDLFELEVPSSMSVEELELRAREAADTKDKGRLVFKGRPLKDRQASLDEAGISREPHSLHLMLSRKHRPPEVAARAAAAAEEFNAAMAVVAAEAATRPPRRKRTPPPSTPPGA
mmetsp:Transcript_1475/g.4308  ORF Transcript_1475/g.4308 Transcript_1475/m.4308 type:complete len:230 (+) Transcript_1475:80-769(+)